MATPRKKTTAKPGKAVATRAGTNVVNIDQQMDAEVAGIMDSIGAPGGNKIKTAGKMFTFPDGSVAEGPIELVVIDFGSKNAFYEGKYDPKNPAPPVCFSLGKQIKSMVPSGNSPEKQSDDCNSCPMNAFGSDGDGKACKNTRLLTVLRPGDDPTETPLMLLEVSPTALKSFDAFVGTVAKMFSAPPVKMIATVDFHPEKEHAQLVFSSPTPNPDYAVHYGRRPEAEVILSTEPDVSGYTAAAKKPARRRRA